MACKRSPVRLRHSPLDLKTIPVRDGLFFVLIWLSWLVRPDLSGRSPVPPDKSGRHSPPKLKGYTAKCGPFCFRVIASFSSAA